MNPAERQAAFDARTLALARQISSLSAPVRAFIGRWRRSIELAGRCGPQGCSLGAMEEFVRDVVLVAGPIERMPPGTTEIKP